MPKKRLSNVLITGGAGFLGSNLAEALIQENYSVTVLDNFSTGSIRNLVGFRSKLKIVKGSINEEEDLVNALTDIDLVFHKAAIASTKQSAKEPGSTLKINLLGTEKLLQCIATSSVKKLVFASSAAVYGNSSKLPISETSKTSPVSIYGLSKLQAEKKCIEFQKSVGIDMVILRIFNVYGPKRSIPISAGVVDRSRSGDIIHSRADTKRIETELGFSARVRLEDGLRITLSKLSNIANRTSVTDRNILF